MFREGGEWPEVFERLGEVLGFQWRRGGELNPRIKVLQTFSRL